MTARQLNETCTYIIYTYRIIIPKRPKHTLTRVPIVFVHITAATTYALLCLCVNIKCI